MVINLHSEERERKIEAANVASQLFLLPVSIASISMALELAD